MKNRSLIILFVVAAAVGAYYFLVEKPRVERTRVDRAAEDRLPLIDPSTVARIRVDRKAGTLAFEIVGTHWQMTSPLSDLADQAAIGRLIASLSEAEIFRNLGRDVDAAQFGLSPPAVTIAFYSEKGDTISHLEIGDYTVDRAWVYTRHRGQVLLLPTGLNRYSAAPVEDYRNRRVAAFDVSVVASFSVRGTAREYSWTRGDNGWFTVAGADTIAGSTTAVEAVLRQLRGLRARRFPPASNAARLFDNTTPSVTVIRAQPHPPLRIQFASTDSATVIAFDSRRYVEVDTSIASVFRMKTFDLRDRRLLRFQPQDVHRVAVATADTSATFVRTGQSWAHPNPAFGRLNQRQVAAVVRHLRSLSFRSIVSEQPPAAAWAGSTISVVLSDAGGKMMDEIQGRRPDGSDDYLVTGRSLAGVVRIDAAAIDELERLLRRVRSKSEQP